MVLARHGIDWFVLDDGFQHLKLSRDADIVLVDATDPFGGGTVLPAGRLREPLSALRRADIVVITRSVQAPSPAIEAIIRRHTSSPIFYASTRLESVLRVPSLDVALPQQDWQKARFLAFCGIGNPAAFFEDLRNWGFQVVRQRSFVDHHVYTAREAADWSRMRQAAAPMRCYARKKMCGISETFSSRRFQSIVAGFRFDMPEDFWSAVADAIGRRESGRGAMKILVRAPNWVGDAVMAIPGSGSDPPYACRRRNLHFGAACRCGSVFGTTVCGPDPAIRFSRTASRDGWAVKSLIGELRKEKFDIAVLLQNAFEAAWLAWRAGIPEAHRICPGWARSAAHEGDSRAPQEGEIPKHESHYYLELLRRAGWIEGSPAIPPIRLHISDAARTGGGIRAAERGRKTKRMALRDCPWRFLRRGKMLAAGAFRAPCRPPDFGMWRRCDIFWHAR